MTSEQTKVNTPWGYYQFIFRSPNFVMKKIVVAPGKRTSLQKHEKRSEYWGVESGHGECRFGDITSVLLPSNTIFVPKGMVHRITNIGQEPLIIFETQIGVCEEEDVLRLEDDYGRKTI